jgi:hypothetical protein
VKEGVYGMGGIGILVGNGYIKGPFGQTMSLVIPGVQTMSLLMSLVRDIKRDIRRDITSF